MLFRFLDAPVFSKSESPLHLLHAEFSCYLATFYFHYCIQCCRQAQAHLRKKYIEQAITWAPETGSTKNFFTFTWIFIVSKFCNAWFDIINTTWKTIQVSPYTWLLLNKYELGRGQINAHWHKFVFPFCKLIESHTKYITGLCSPPKSIGCQLQVWNGVGWGVQSTVSTDFWDS